MALGETFKTTEITTTPLEVKEAPGANGAGLISNDQRYVGVKVKTCTVTPGYLGPLRWRIIGDDGGEYGAQDITPAPGDWLHPTYPNDQPGMPERAAGSCATGWVMIGVTRGVQPSKLQYLADDETAVWKAS